MDPVPKVPPTLESPGVKVPLESGILNSGPALYAAFRAVESLFRSNFSGAFANLSCLTEFWVSETHSVSRYCQRVNLLLQSFEAPNIAHLVSMQLLKNAKQLNQSEASEKMQSLRKSLADYAGTILESLTIDAQAMYRYLEEADWKDDWPKVALTFAALAYVANPWGVIPDIIPVIGRFDDYIVLRIVSRMLEPELTPIRIKIREERQLEAVCK